MTFGSFTSNFEPLFYIKKTLQLHGKILDLGIENKLSERMQKEGSLVKNTNGKDLDLYPSVYYYQLWDSERTGRQNHIIQ